MKLYKTYKIQIECDNQEKLEKLQEYWFKLVNTVVKMTVRLGTINNLELQNKLYSILRKYTKEKWNLHSYYLPSAFKIGSEIVRACVKACKNNCRTRFPTISKDLSISLTTNTVRFQEERENVYAYIAFQPRNPIKVKLNFSRNIDYYQELNLALQNKIFRIKGVKLLKRNSEWFLYVSVEKEAHMPNWNYCETLVGVDIGMNYLVAITAVSRNTKTVYPTVYIKGKLWKHLQKYKRNKVSKLQSKGANTEKLYQYYNERFKEILNSAANKVIAYAKRFPKPLIVMGNLKGLKSNGNKTFNFLLSNWQRRRLQQLIEYKALWNGIPVRYVNEYYTSITCHNCGNRGKREGTLFYCSTCNRKFNADGNASINIALRGSNFSDDKSMDDRRRTSELISSDVVSPLMPQASFCLTGQERCN
jgi:IS605 OrfB family transposase